MMRALFSGVTGLRSHQTRMDVIGNNIANVNTMGYKKMTTTFKDLYNETISSAASTSGVGATATGGVNAKQIGLGAAVGAISAIHTPGSAQYTGHGMDVAISGDGYFAVLTPTGIKYTRAGEFATDLTGNFVTKEGYYVLTVEPRTSAVESLKVPENGVIVNGLLNQAEGIRGVAHSGNITADLTEVQGEQFSIAFEAADEPWSTRYVGDTTDAYYPDSPATIVKGTTESYLDVKAITDAIKEMAADPNQEVKIGTNEITFEMDEDGIKAQLRLEAQLDQSTDPVQGDTVTFVRGDGSVVATATYNVAAQAWEVGQYDNQYDAPVVTATATGLTLDLTAAAEGKSQEDEGAISALFQPGSGVYDLTLDNIDWTPADATAGTPAESVMTFDLEGTPVDGDKLTIVPDGATGQGDVIELTYNGTAWEPTTFNLPTGYTTEITGTAQRLTLTATQQTPTEGVDNPFASGDISFEPARRLVTGDDATLVDQGKNPGLNMMYGDLVVATADVNSIEAADVNQDTPIKFISELDGTTELGQITVNSPSVLGTDDLVDSVLNKMGSKPMITLEENGQWVIKRGNVTVEKIVMEYSDNVNGGIVGDVQFNTSSYGSFLFDVQADLDGKTMPNQQALAQALNGTFTIEVETEFLPSYTVPAIITADSLKTLQIDFDRYTNVSIDTTGAILGQLKNDEQWEIDGKTVNMDAGDKVTLGYISMATFNNPSGLEKVGDNMFEVSANSGNPVYGTPGNGSAGSLAPSNLEMSNVDLSEEMVNMIITQRGFQANSRIITTTDTMLEELVNLKR